MSKKIHLIILPIILVSILALFSLYGCDGAGGPGGAAPTATPGAADGASLNQQQLAQILGDSVNSYENLNTYRFDMDMDILMDVTGGAQSGKVTINSKISGVAKVATNEKQMNAEMSMNLEGIGEQSVSYEIYQMADWLYINIATPGMGEQWVKMPATVTAMETFNMDPISQQFGPLNSPLKIEYLRSEVVDGQDCYVLGITPDTQALAEWLNEQETGNEETDWQDLVNYADVFKEFSYVCYVTKATNYLKRLTVNMTMEFTAEEAGESPETFDKMTMGITMDINLYDHNASITITLPDEAIDAAEVSEDMFSE